MVCYDLIIYVNTIISSYQGKICWCVSRARCGIVRDTVLGSTRILNSVLNIASFFHKIKFFVEKKSKYVRYTLSGYDLSHKIYICPNSFKVSS